jgi:hypothetical protein
MANRPLDWLKTIALKWDSEKCLIWPFGVDRDGYGRVSVDDVEQRSHRAVFFLEHGRWPSPCALHSCDTPGCCNLRHISEGTHQLNQQQKAYRGRSLRGTSQHSNKLSENQVREIRSLHIPFVKKGPMSTSAIARRYGVTRHLIKLIVRRRLWRHIA